MPTLNPRGIESPSAPLLLVPTFPRCLPIRHLIEAPNAMTSAAGGLAFGPMARSSRHRVRARRAVLAIGADCDSWRSSR